MGMAVMSAASRAYSERHTERDSLQAKWLAEAGISDAWLKLSKDMGFPPRMGSRNNCAWSEIVYDPVTHARIGMYSVVLDVSKRYPPPTADPRKAEAYAYPSCTIVVTSYGYVDGTGGTPVSQRRIVAELDVSPKVRGADLVSGEPLQPCDAFMPPSNLPYYTNPNFNRWLRWEDSGAR